MRNIHIKAIKLIKKMNGSNEMNHALFNTIFYSIIESSIGACHLIEFVKFVNRI